jgi:heptosyltransferase-3
VVEASHSRPQVLTGLSLKELIALIGLARVFVGNDSGPMHVAAALKRPLVAVFGSSNADVWHPWTDSAYRIVGSQQEDSAAGATTSSPAGSRLAIRSVPASRVIAAVDEVLESAPAATSKADAKCLR